MLIENDYKKVGAQPQLSEESIRAWLVEEITRTTGLPLNQIDITEPFSSYGIDSVAAAGLSGELASWLGTQIAPTITWDYPTVKLLACHLAAKLANSERLAA